MPPSKRLIYQQEKGLFLNEKQELIVLEKLLWKEQYKSDAVSMYYVNIALEERVQDLINQNKLLKGDLNLCENESLKAVSSAEQYKILYDQSKDETSKLQSKNFSLKTNLVVFKIITVSLGIIVVYEAYLLVKTL